MPLSDLILSGKELVVILSASELGIAPNGIALNFGTVQLISDLCDRVSVGHSVWFDIKNATPFMIISGQTFYKLKESDISASEPYTP